jgi:CTP synthase (UTP-ammonia lyase)
MKPRRKLVILGEHNPAWETHQATDAAIAHAQEALGVALDVAWVSTEEFGPRVLDDVAGLWVATGLPYKNRGRALDVVQTARERGVPCLATCQGFQHFMLEHARAFLGIADPGHAEYDPAAERPFISELACSLRGQAGEVQIAEGSRAFAAYGAGRTTERYYCSYGVDPGFVSRLDRTVLRISGTDAQGGIRIVEYRGHPFMVGTLFVPQVRSQPGQPHPLALAFVRAMAAG